MQFAIDSTLALAKCSRVDNAVRSIKLKFMPGMHLQHIKNSETLMMAKVLALLKNLVVDRRSIQSS